MTPQPKFGSIGTSAHLRRVRKNVAINSWPVRPSLIIAVESGPRWTDVWTAWGTVALAGATFLLAAATFGIFLADRKRSDKILKSERRRAEADRRAALRRLEEERTQAAERLREEREIAERRLTDERAWAEEQRRRERQNDAAAELLECIADITQRLGSVPEALSRSNSWPGGSHPPHLRVVGLEEAQQAIRTLQRGAWTAVARLDHPEAAERYRNLVHLVLTVANQHRSDNRARDVSDLRNYARWVRITLRELIDTGGVPHIDDHERVPELSRNNEIPWFPSNPVPPGWHEDIETDDADVRFQPAE